MLYFAENARNEDVSLELLGFRMEPENEDSKGENRSEGWRESGS